MRVFALAQYKKRGHSIYAMWSDLQGFMRQILRRRDYVTTHLLRVGQTLLSCQRDLARLHLSRNLA